MAWYYSGHLGAITNESGLPTIPIAVNALEVAVEPQALAIVVGTNITVDPIDITVAGTNVGVPFNSGPALNLSKPLRECLVNDIGITSRLGQYLSYPSVHTRTPVPVQAEYPMITISSDIGVTDEDGLKSRRPVITRVIRVFGIQENQFRVVEELGYLIRGKFHRNKNSLTVPGHHVIDVVASGPVEGVQDDESRTERVVTLTVRLVRT